MKREHDEFNSIEELIEHIQLNGHVDQLNDFIQFRYPGNES